MSFYQFLSLWISHLVIRLYQKICGPLKFHSMPLQGSDSWKYEAIQFRRETTCWFFADQLFNVLSPQSICSCACYNLMLVQETRWDIFIALNWLASERPISFLRKWPENRCKSEWVRWCRPRERTWCLDRYFLSANMTIGVCALSISSKRII